MVVGDTVADTHVRFVASQGKRLNTLTRYRSEGDGDIIVSNGWYRDETELRIIAGDSSIIDVEVLGQRVACTANDDGGGDGVVAHLVFSVGTLYASALVSIDDAAVGDSESRLIYEVAQIE